MKNFTNIFKQITSRLSARWLIMALMMLVGTSSTWGAKRIYCKNTQSWWKADGAAVGVHYWGGSTGTTWPGLRMTPVAGETDLWYYDVPDGHTYVIFTRVNGSGTIADWGAKTGDLTIPTDGKNLYTITSSSAVWGDPGVSGSWSTYTPPCDPPTLSLINVSTKVSSGSVIDLNEESGAEITSGSGDIVWYSNSDCTEVVEDPANVTYSGTDDKYFYVKAVGTSCSSTMQSFKISACYTFDGSTYLYFDINKSYFKEAGAVPNVSFDDDDFTTNYDAELYGEQNDYIYRILVPAGCYQTMSVRRHGDSFWNPCTNISLLEKGDNNTFIVGDNWSNCDYSWGITEECTKPEKPSIELSTSSICNDGNTQVTITVTGEAETFKLYTVTNNGNLLKETKNTKTFTVEPTQTTTYVVKALNGTCESVFSEPKEVTVSDKPIITLTSESKEICKGDELDLSDFASTTAGNLTWWDGDTQITEPVSPEQNKTYTVKAVNGACTVSDGFSVTVNSRPEKPILVTKSTSRCQAEESVNLNTLAGVSGVNWYDSNSELVTNGNVSIITAGTYTFTAKAVNNEGCESAEASELFTLTVKSLANASNYKLKDGKTSSDYTGSAITLLAEDITISNGAADVTRIYFKQNGSEVDAKEVGTYDVYINTEEIDNICAGSDLKIGTFTISCQKPTSPEASSTQNVIKCGADYKQYGIITINPFNQNLTYKLNVETDITSATIENLTEGEYSITATRTCGSTLSTSDPIIVSITATDATPTITASAAVTQPNVALTLNSAAGDATEWEVSTNPNEAGSITESTGASVIFSATEIGEYVVTATNGDCSFNFTITVKDASYVYVRRPKSGDGTNVYSNWYANSNVEGGPLYIKRGSITAGNASANNQGGNLMTEAFTDCNGFVWDKYEIATGQTQFHVHAANEKAKTGYATFSNAGIITDNQDYYFILSSWTTGQYGVTITKTSDPRKPTVHNLGSTTLGTDEFAALYVTDCSGKEITGYQWYKDGQPYSSVCSYVGKKGEENSNAGETNNIRPTVAGYYSCTVTYGDETTATSAAVKIDGTYNRSFTSTIPVLVVNTGDEDFPGCQASGADNYPSKYADELKAKRSVDVKIYDGEGALVYDRKARMAYRGSSSLNFTKKSYAFCPGKANCGDEDKGADYVKTEKLNMLGVGNAVDKDWVLYAAAADPSLMRNRMVFDTYQAMRNDWGVHSRYVELIVNGEYKGVYVFMDKITMNENRVEVNEDNGFIVKFDKTDCADRVGGYGGIIGDEKTFSTERTGRYGISTYHTTVDQLFEIEYPEKDDYPTGWASKVATIKGMFQAFEDALEAGDYATVQKYIDYDSWADWFIINEFTKNLDAYRASCIFVYTGEAGAKIEARPLWDQELSFNNAAANISGKGANSTSGLLIQNDGVYTDCFPAPFWFTGQLATFGNCGVNNGSGEKGDKLANCLLNDPCFVQVIKEKWNQHQFDALSADALGDLITKYDNELGYTKETGSKILDRESDEWPNDFRTSADCSAGSTGYNEVSYSDSKTAIINWIADGAGGRREGLTTAINGLTGTSFSIQIIPSGQTVTPWEPANISIAVTPAGYDYKLEYTGDNNLGGVVNTIIEKEGNSISYRIPRPKSWGTGDETTDGEREDVVYGIKATLNVAEGNMECGSSAAPYSEAEIILADEDNEKCPQ